LVEAAALDSVKEAMEQARIDNLLDEKTTHPEFEIVQNNIETAKNRNIKTQRQQKVKRWLTRGAVAACVLLTSFGGWMDYLKRDIEKDLVEAFNYFPEDSPDLIEVSGGADVAWSKLKKAVNEKRFDKAFGLIEVLRKEYDYDRSEELTYYEAVLYAQTENYIKSTAILRKLINENAEIKNDARWLAGLIYLKTNEKGKAKKEFEILVTASEKYKNKAREKLKKHFLL